MKFEIEFFYELYDKLINKFSTKNREIQKIIKIIK